MSRERYEQEIVQELESELRQALAIEASPDFALRVRERIEQRGNTSLLGLGRWQVAAAAAASCAIVVGIGWHAGDLPLKPKAPTATTRAGVDVRLKPEITVASKPPERLRVTPTRVRASVKAIEPEVIVPPDQARALARLLELARSGVVNEETLRPVISAAVPATLDVAPIVVPSIPVRDVDIQSGVALGGTGGE